MATQGAIAHHALPTDQCTAAHLQPLIPVPHRSPHPTRSLAVDPILRRGLHNHTPPSPARPTADTVSRVKRALTYLSHTDTPCQRNRCSTRHRICCWATSSVEARPHRTEAIAPTLSITRSTCLQPELLATSSAHTTPNNSADCWLQTHRGHLRMAGPCELHTPTKKPPGATGQAAASVYTRIAGPSVGCGSHPLPPAATASKRPLHTANGTHRAEGGPRQSHARAPARKHPAEKPGRASHPMHSSSLCRGLGV